MEERRSVSGKRSGGSEKKQRVFSVRGTPAVQMMIGLAFRLSGFQVVQTVDDDVIGVGREAEGLEG